MVASIFQVLECLIAFGSVAFLRLGTHEPVKHSRFFVFWFFFLFRE